MATITIDRLRTLLNRIKQQRQNEEGLRAHRELYHQLRGMQGSNEADSLVVSGRKKYEEGDLQGAHKDFSKSLETSSNPAAFVNRGCVEMDLENYERAIADLNSATVLEPKLGAAYHNLAMAVMTALYDREEAVATDQVGDIIRFAKRELETALDLGYAQSSRYLDMIKNRLASSSSTSNRDLGNVRFISDDHVRYEDGHEVSGNNKGANRGIEIELNTQGGEGYTVTFYNLDGDHPAWGDNVQMTPKQMRVVRESENEIELRGFGSDSLGSSFSDYGVTIHYNGDEIEKVVLHMHDRNVDIEYLAAKEQDSQGESGQENNPAREEGVSRRTRELQQLVESTIESFRSDDHLSMSRDFKSAHRIVKDRHDSLPQLASIKSLGNMYAIMSDHYAGGDVDFVQQVASTGYYILSVQCSIDPKLRLRYIKDRYMTEKFAEDAFIYTVMSGLGERNRFLGMNDPSEDWAKLYAMQFADLAMLSPVMDRVSYGETLREEMKKLDVQRERGVFGLEKDSETFLKEGQEHHADLQEYLHDRLVKEGDFDF